MRSLRRLSDPVYALGTSLWRWWPIDPPRLRRSTSRARAKATADGAPNGNPRVAYYLWHFPVLSQTFVQREIRALRESGVAVTVLADDAEDVAMLDEEARRLVDSTHYLRPVHRRRLARYRRRFRRTRSLAYANLFFWLMSRRYGLAKTWRGDRRLFRNVVYLAGRLDDVGADRVHAPWGDRCGFIAMMAARLLGIPFSVQVRAHDLHDPSYHQALRDVLRHADFVITNTQYNRPFVEELRTNGRLTAHTIYNGIDLAKFVPPTRARAAGAPLRILCVGRLVEPKGLTYLLDASAILRDRGVAFTCEVIGGAEPSLYGDYLVELRVRHRVLRLEKHVRFLDAVPFGEVMEAYSRADVFVLPCVTDRYGRRDVTPNALIEAMAMKLPVVSTAMTGIVEIVENEESGLLVAPGDTIALADAIERIARDEPLARALAEKARAHVESRFDLHRNVLERVRLFAPSTNGA